MAKILIISPTPTHPQDAGNRARIFRLLTTLKEAGHWVGFVFLRMEQGDESAMSEAWDYFTAMPYCRPCVRRTKRWHDGLMKWLGSQRRAPFLIDDWFDNRVLPLIDDLHSRVKPDVVMVEYVFLSKALDVINPDTYKIIDTHDVFSGRQKIFYDSNLQPLWFYTTANEEKVGLNRADCILAIQEEEAKYLSELTKNKVLTVGHIIETDGSERSERHDCQLLFVGSENDINIHAVNWFTAKVLPMIRVKVPNVVLNVVGGCAHLVEPRDGVVAVGRVPDLSSWYSQAAVVVNPIQFGTGLKIKAIEALAAGCPMVSTSVGVTGLAVGAGDAFLVADTPAEFSDAVIKVLQSQGMRSQLSENAMQYAMAYNQSAIKPLIELLEEIDG